MLWSHELKWRLLNPKITFLLATAVISLAIFLTLNAFGTFTTETPDGEQTFSFNPGSAVGMLFSGLTFSGALIWGFGAFITEAIVPGTNTLAERLSLGQGDPFERFREHFYRTMERVKRPVLVVVDDIDRCRPDFIVELVRGMQTLLRSPRIVFLVIGDRDWIERAFEAHHKAMNKVSVGPEQTFGARFVEKAIQMSFILPGMLPERQAEYVQNLLVGRRDVQAGTATSGITPENARELRGVIQKTIDAQGDRALQTKKMRETMLLEIQTAFKKRRPKAAAQTTAKSYDRWLSQELAKHAAVDEAVEEEVSHRLLPLAPYFPSNPRQIKRIVNAVTIYQAVAIHELDLTSDDDLWFQLAIWIIVMTEWPRSWQLLAAYPAAIDLVTSDDPETAIKSFAEADLPGPPKATLKAVEAIRLDGNLMALLTGSGGRQGPTLDREAIQRLSALTPVDRGREPLGSESDDAREEADAEDQDA